MAGLLSLLLAVVAALPSLPHSSDVYVSGFFTSSVQRFYGPRSATRGPRPGRGRSGASYAQPVTRRPWGLAFGPDGNLYVANFGTGTDAIMRVQGPFAPDAGSVSTFVNTGVFFDVAFGPDGNLYAGGRGPIQRFDIVTGEPLGEFTSGHDLQEVHAIAFGPDGNLYVTNYSSGSNEIVRFDGLTGAFVDVFAGGSGSGLGQVVWDIAFGPNDALFVASDASVLRYDRPSVRTRAVAYRANNVFATYPVTSMLAIAFGPDQNLYVSASDSSGAAGSILRFDGKTGAFLDAFVPAVEGGPRGIAFAPGPN